MAYIAWEQAIKISYIARRADQIQENVCVFCIWLMSVHLLFPGFSNRRQNENVCISSTLMAKMKSADSIYLALGLEPTGELVTCSALNRAALDLALSVASPTALGRLEARGRNLTLGADLELAWGVPWELSSLQWETLEDGTVQLTSSRLTSGWHRKLLLYQWPVLCTN